MHPLKLKSSILPVVPELNDFYEIIFLKLATTNVHRFWYAPDEY